MLKLEKKVPLRRESAMTVMDAIYGRRSVRAYAPQPLERTVIRDLIGAAIQAPTAVHEEPWAFAVIEDRETLRRLSDTAKELLHEVEHGIHLPGAGSRRFKLPENVFYDAGTLIVIYGKPLGPFVVADCWLAAENLMLAARAMGLGSCVIGLAVAALNMPEWKAELKVPSEMTAYAPIIVGVPKEEPPPTGRQDPQILIWKTGLV
ncbi:MAG TPA: nitroreductase family protein [Elusimicrobiota bacterium]|jgi:nitroreductase|nr:nitroreductase family protein [Elusimicrobiota bacterium]